MTAKQPHERYQSADVLIDALTSALAASNLSMPRPYRISPFASGPIAEVKNQQSVSGVSQCAGGAVQSGPQSQVMLTCLRCGALNRSTQLLRTTCGDDLSDRPRRLE